MQQYFQPDNADPTYSSPLEQRFSTESLPTNPQHRANVKFDKAVDDVKRLVTKEAAIVLGRKLPAIDTASLTPDDYAESLGLQLLPLSPEASKRASFRNRTGFTVIDRQALETCSEHIELVSVALARSPQDRDIIVPVIHFHTHPQNAGLNIQSNVEKAVHQLHGQSVAALLESKGERTRRNLATWLYDRRKTILALTVLGAGSVSGYIYRAEISAGYNQLQTNYSNYQKQKAIEAANERFQDQTKAISELKGLCSALNSAPTAETKKKIVENSDHINDLYSLARAGMSNQRFSIEERREMINLMGQVLAGEVRHDQKSLDQALEDLKPVFMFEDATIRHSAVDWYRTIAIGKSDLQ